LPLPCRYLLEGGGGSFNLKISNQHKTSQMKNADRPFIGLIIVSIALLYGIIAILA